MTPCSFKTAADIRNHPWFTGYDWEGLRAHRLESPIRVPEAEIAKAKAQDVDPSENIHFFANLELAPRIAAEEQQKWDRF